MVYDYKRERFSIMKQSRISVVFSFFRWLHSIRRYYVVGWRWLDKSRTAMAALYPWIWHGWGYQPLVLAEEGSCTYLDTGWLK